MRNEIQDILLNIVLFSGAVSVGYKQPKRKLFLARFIGSFLFMCLFRYFVFREIYPMPEDGMFLASSCFGFLMLLVILCLTMWFSFECDFWGALFCGIAGYCIQHVIERGYSIIRILFMQGASGFACGTVLVLLSAAVIASVYFLFRGSIRGRITVNNKLLLGVAAVVVFATILLDVLSIATWIPAGSDATACGFAFSLMVGLVTFFMQMGLLSTKKIEEERDLIRQVMEESKEQYYFEKSIIDTVNVKVHDIKHQIAALDRDDREKVLKDAKPIIEVYDSAFKTDCPPLDVILTRKSFICREKGIQLTCMAEGKALGFMSETDVYSLFGNILENAIEAAEKLPDDTKKVITLTVRKNESFVTITEANYFSGELSYSDGLPRTTKRNTDIHGYGLKSIKMIAEEYGGSIKVSTREDRFLLDIIFPV